VKFRITLKDPDGFNDSLNDAVRRQFDRIKDRFEDEKELEEFFGQKTSDMYSDYLEREIEKLSQICRQWFKWGEYLTVEVDTLARTCTIMEADKT
jgi:hypothetical protein